MSRKYKMVKNPDKDFYEFWKDDEIEVTETKQELKYESLGTEISVDDYAE